jgi:hypothetical protein
MLFVLSRRAESFVCLAATRLPLDNNSSFAVRALRLDRLLSSLRIH